MKQKTKGVYGDVQRVKILYNKKDSALIQMAEPQQAYLGKWKKLFSRFLIKEIFLNWKKNKNYLAKRMSLFAN